MSRKLEKTKYTSIFKYQTTKGTRYRVRFSFVLDSIKEEYSKSGLLNLSQARELLATAELKPSKGQSPNEDVSKKHSVNSFFNIAINGVRINIKDITELFLA